MFSFIHDTFSLSWRETYFLGAILAGYGFSVFVGGIFINWFFREIRECIPPRESGYEWLNSIIIGPIERILIVTSMLKGYPEFIGFWILFKAAIRWSSYERHDNKGDISSNFNPRLADHVYIIGNGLMILYSWVGYMMINWIYEWDWLPAIIVPILIVVMTIFCTIYISCVNRYMKIHLTRTGTVAFWEKSVSFFEIVKCICLRISGIIKNKNKIKKLLESKGLTNSDLARLRGLCKSQIIGMLDGKVKGDSNEIATAVEHAEKFKITLDDPKKAESGD